MYSLGYIISNNLLIYQKSTPSNYIVGIYPTNIIISIWDIYPPVIKCGSGTFPIYKGFFQPPKPPLNVRGFLVATSVITTG